MFRKIVSAAFLSFALVTCVFAVKDVEFQDKILKIRTEGICYMDPGITTDQAKLISKYDAIHQSLIKLSSFLEANDSLVNGNMPKNSIIQYLSNSLEVIVLQDGEEKIDGYPAYLSNVVCQIHIDNLNRFLLNAKIDNRFRYQLISEYERINDVFVKIKSLKSMTNKIPDRMIEEIVSKLTATEWANKGHLTDQEGLKLEYYAIAIDYDNSYESAHLFMAESMMKVGKYAEVLSMFNRLINSDALRYPAVYARRGEVYYLQKQYSPAIKELEKAIAIKPDYADSYCVLGMVYAALNKNDQALEQLGKAISADEGFYKPYSLRATIYRKAGKYDLALKDYDKAIALNPRISDSYFNRGIIYYLMGNFEKSVEEYSKALYFDELSPAIYFNRAITYRKLEMLKKATEDYKTYLLLTVKDINKESYGELVNAWMADEKFKPMLQD
jgi:tetratricopeptide (TPR) repeat protein